MDRIDILRSLFDTSGFGLEVGPSYSPLVPKRDGYRVESIDHATQAELVAKYRTHPVDTSRIEPVDHVSDGRPMAEVIGKTAAYDYIVASHVIEHTTDFVGFLRDCGTLLKPNGRLVLAVPDRRYCFDFFRPVSSPGQIIAAHLQGRERHSFDILFDNIALAARRAGEITWSAVDRRPIEFVGDPVAALAAARGQIDDGAYHDAHAWTFTPSSFRAIVAMLDALGLVRLRIAELRHTGEFEFYAVLTAEAPTEQEGWRDLLAQRMAEETRICVDESHGEPSWQAGEIAFDQAWKARHDAILASRSWRYTAPLRAAGRAVRRVLRK